MSKAPPEIQAFRIALGENVKYARKSAGFTQADIVDRVGVNRPTWSKIEHGTQAMRVEILAQFCSIVGCDPTSIIPLKVNGSQEGENAKSVQGAMRTIARARGQLDVGYETLARLLGSGT